MEHEGLDNHLFAQDERIIRLDIEQARARGDHSLVISLIKENCFKDGKDLIEAWDNAHYHQAELNKRRPLTSLEKFRIRQKYLPPPSISKTLHRKKMSHSPNVRKILNQWLLENYSFPYPSPPEVLTLSDKTGLTVTQVKTWFANTRRRLKDSECDMIEQPLRQSTNSSLPLGSQSLHVFQSEGQMMDSVPHGTNQSHTMPFQSQIEHQYDNIPQANQGPKTTFNVLVEHQCDSAPITNTIPSTLYGPQCNSIPAVCETPFPGYIENHCQSACTCHSVQSLDEYHSKDVAGTNGMEGPFSINTNQPHNNIGYTSNQLFNTPPLELIEPYVNLVPPLKIPGNAAILNMRNMTAAVLSWQIPVINKFEDMSKENADWKTQKFNKGKEQENVKGTSSVLSYAALPVSWMMVSPCANKCVSKERAFETKYPTSPPSMETVQSAAHVLLDIANTRTPCH